MAPRYGFGFVDGWHKIERKFWPGVQAGAYLSRYFVRGRGAKAPITETVLADDLPRVVVFVSRRLTTESNCTMRNLRRSRRLWVCLRHELPFPTSWTLEDLAGLDRFCPLAAAPARSP
jgi:hypothetical protein